MEVFEASSAATPSTTRPCVGVFGVELLEPGHLDFAGAAPRGPEVDQHGLALVKSASETFLPSRSTSEKAGAILPCSLGSGPWLSSPPALPAGIREACAAALSLACCMASRRERALCTPAQISAVTTTIIARVTRALRLAFEFIESILF